MSIGFLKKVGEFIKKVSQKPHEIRLRDSESLFIKKGRGKTPTNIAPGTKVYELVEELAKYLPEGQRKAFL